jgi:ATP-dependent helicase/nuclease subunit A
MNNITLYNASAGSGKTHTVSEEIIKRIQNGLDPERIIATTFTNKAADELKERIRKDLIKKGMYDSAIRINSAQIGTVNSIGGRLLEKYALFAGLPPKLKVIDDNTASIAIKQIISKHITEDFIQLAERMDQEEDEKYVKDIYRIAVAIRANDMEKEQIKASVENSLAEAIQVYGRPDQSNSWEPKMKMLIDKLKPFIKKAEADPDVQNKKRGYAGAYFAN